MFSRFSLAVRHRGHKQRELNDMFNHFFCLGLLGLAIKLNLNMSKVAYCIVPVRFSVGPSRSIDFGDQGEILRNTN